VAAKQEQSDFTLGGAGSKTPSPTALVKRMLGLAWRYKWRCFNALLLQAILLILSLAGLGFVGLGIDYIRGYVDDAVDLPTLPWGIAWPDWHPLAVVGALAGGLLLFTIMQGVVQYFHTVAVTNLTQRGIVVDLRTAAYDKLQRLSFRFFDANESGSIINRLTSDTQQVGMFVSNVMLQAINLVMALAIFLVYMLNIHVSLTLACLATTPILWASAVLFSKMVRPAYMRNRELVDHLIRVLSENLQGVHVVKGFSLQDQETRKFIHASAEVQEQRHWIFNRLTWFVPSVNLLVEVNLTILLAYGGYLVITGELALGAGLVVFARLLTMLGQQVNQLANITNTVQVCLTGAQRVFELLDAPLEVQSPAQKADIERIEGKVKFDGVTFGYRLGDAVLRDVDFEVQPGQRVAILGATGAGKTTLLALIPRFYDPVFGRVLIDDVDVRNIDLDQLRKSIGIVFQENFLFSNTVAENIAFGHPDASREQIEKAAKMAQAHDFIMEDLKDGYDTILAEGGGDLSGGQQQRLAIARALLLEPPILLLDDPTAAIDPETEQEILAAMEQAMENRTTFVVAHRLSTLRRADLVIVMHRGRIVQTGTHRELMATPGAYKEAAELQVADDEDKRLLNEPTGGDT